MAESDWDRRLNNLLDDLENSAAEVPSSTGQQRTTTSAHHHQRENGYSVIRSESGASVPDDVLKNLNTALNASTSYIETHRTTTGPDGRTQEFHEYRTYGGDGREGEIPTDRTVGDFDLERSVQHMMPSTTSTHPHHTTTITTPRAQTEKVATQKTTMYKVQSSNSGSSSNTKTYQTSVEPDRPGSRLKQNIDELDTLLYDLNHARKMSDADYSVTPGNLSSDDYSCHEGRHTKKRTVHSYNDVEIEVDPRKPPSPSPRRRTTSTGLSSPASVRNAGPPSTHQTSTTRVTTTTYKSDGDGGIPPGGDHRPGYKYEDPRFPDVVTKYDPSHRQPSNPFIEDEPPRVSSHAYTNDGRNVSTTTTTRYDYRTTDDNNRIRGNLQPPQPEPYYSAKSDDEGPYRNSPVPLKDGTPTGVSYYTKYHSTHSHMSQHQGTPKAFPNSGRNTPIVPSSPQPPATQQPPKRVDELFTELSEVDPSIQPGTFIEPSPPNKTVHTSYRHDDDDVIDYRHDNGHQYPARPTTPSATTPLTVTHTTSLRRRGKGRGEARAKSKSKHSESDSKQGAAVVPICLPLCCAAPCVLL